METLDLPLDKMTTAEKLALLDLVWDDLRPHAAELPSPEWHGLELERRQGNPNLEFSDYRDVIKRIRQRI